MLFMLTFLAVWAFLNALGVIFTHWTGYTYAKLPQVRFVRRAVLMFYAPLCLVAFAIFVIEKGDFRESWNYWDHELNMGWDWPTYVPFYGWQMPRV